MTTVRMGAPAGASTVGGAEEEVEGPPSCDVTLDIGATGVDAVVADIALSPDCPW